jgi:N-acetylglucosamine kinase-like BadF-type ATPase
VICVGVDAGGTATIAAVSDDGAFVREVRGAGANPTTRGVDDAAGVIAQTVRAALNGAQAGAIHVGAAGAGRASVAARLEQQLASAFPAARITVGDDASIALRAGLPEGDGAVLIAGTGSVAYAERDGDARRVGGLGYLAGDEGSAFWIGWQAVKLFGRVLDGRAARDETTDLVARALDASDRDRYLGALYDTPREPATIAALAPIIIAFAGKGNRAATKIVQAAAMELSDLVKAALRGVALLDASPRVVLTGGLFGENSLLTFLVETRIVGDVPGVQLLKGGDEPVRGALRCAQRGAR